MKYKFIYIQLICLTYINLANGINIPMISHFSNFIRNNGHRVWYAISAGMVAKGVHELRSIEKPADTRVKKYAQGHKNSTICKKYLNIVNKPEQIRGYLFIAASLIPLFFGLLHKIAYNKSI